MKSSQKFTHLALLTGAILSQAGCAILLDPLLSPAFRENALNERMEEVQRLCTLADTQGNSFLKLKVEEREWPLSEHQWYQFNDKNPLSLNNVDYALSNCKKKIEEILGAKYTSAMEESLPVVQDPSTEGFELNGKKIGLADAYRQVFDLHKKVLESKIGVCAYRRGNISSTGDGINNWTPLGVSIGEHSYVPCGNGVPGSQSFHASTPTELRETIIKECGKAEIKTSGLEVERVDLNLYRKIAYIHCNWPKENVPISKITRKLEVDSNCEPCKAWVK